MVAAHSKMPEQCDQDPFCKIVQAVIGRDTLLKFKGEVNLKGFKIKAGIADRPITDTVKFKKIEVFFAVSPKSLKYQFHARRGARSDVVRFV